ncbi:MAG: DUF4091 domain-containing protein [Candidatus Aureabacteria bacterium]|nr:DUF4091 domain-containing protein [Candidatus Auribacterota bacterium]
MTMLPAARRRSPAPILSLALLAPIVLAAVAAAGGCLAGRMDSPAITVWATGDSAQVFPSAPIETSNHHWQGSPPALLLKGARNEWVAAQLVLNSPRTVSSVSVEVGDLRGDARVIPRSNIRLFVEIYVPVKNATDRSGSTGPGEYPDPLVPFDDPYSPPGRGIAAPFSLPRDRNFPVWIDLFIPPGTPPGTYRGEITVTVRDRPAKIVGLELTVWSFALPARRSLQVFFDLYAYRFSQGEGRPFALSDETWEALQHYEIMAHEHGFSNGHWGLMPDILDEGRKIDWTLYDRYLGQVLDGSLFDDRAPPACWELPFPENWDPGETVLRNYCREIVRHWEEKGWDLSSAFAYVFDERGPLNPQVKRYGQILAAASGERIDFFYTCPPHPNLFGVVDIWCPRASEYGPEEMRARQKEGEKGFFYHAGEPSVGLMCLDTIGVAFRTWAWIAWKYGADGFFDWASNFWGDSPYTDPASHGEDNGNMYLFYPGRKLDTIGLPPVSGPISSFRMKMVRRGIQDYEYFRLAQGLGLDPDPIVDSIVRRGLQEAGAAGIDSRAWSRDAEDWYRARDALGGMIDAKNEKKLEFKP